MLKGRKTNESGLRVNPDAYIGPELQLWAASHGLRVSSYAVSVLEERHAGLGVAVLVGRREVGTAMFDRLPGSGRVKSSVS